MEKQVGVFRVSTPLVLLASLLVALAARGEGTMQSLAEFRLYEDTVSKIGATAHRTDSLWRRGQEVFPDVNVTVKTQLQDSANSIHLTPVVGVTGTAFTRIQKQIGRKMTTVDVTSNVNASFSKDIIGNFDGLTAGPLRGEFNVQVQHDTDTEFRRLAGRLVHRLVDRAVPRHAAPEIDRAENEMRAGIEMGVNQAIARGNHTLRTNLEDLSGFKKLAVESKLSPSLYTKAPRPGEPGYLATHLWANTATKIEPRPTLKGSDKAAAELYLHEEAFTLSVAPQLAASGPIPLSDAFKQICDSPFAKKLGICDSDKMKKARVKADGVVVTFDKEEPFKVTFRNGKIHMVLNARHEKEVEGSPKIQGQRFRIEVVYNVTPEKISREALTVRPIEEEQLAEAKPEKPAEKTHSGLAGVMGSLTRAARNVEQGVSSVGRSGRTAGESLILHGAYAEAFEPEYVFPDVNIPATVHVENPKEDGTSVLPPTLTSSLDLKPIDAKAENGWFAINTAATVKPESKPLNLTLK